MWVRYWTFLHSWCRLHCSLRLQKMWHQSFTLITWQNNHNYNNKKKKTRQINKRTKQRRIRRNRVCYTLSLSSEVPVERVSRLKKHCEPYRLPMSGSCTLFQLSPYMVNAALTGKAGNRYLRRKNSKSMTPLPMTAEMHWAFPKLILSFTHFIMWKMHLLLHLRLRHRTRAPHKRLWQIRYSPRLTATNTRTPGHCITIYDNALPVIVKSME